MYWMFSGRRSTTEDKFENWINFAIIAGEVISYAQNVPLSWLELYFKYLAVMEKIQFLEIKELTKGTLFSSTWVDTIKLNLPRTEIGRMILRHMETRQYLRKN